MVGIIDIKKLFFSAWCISGFIFSANDSQTLFAYRKDQGLLILNSYLKSLDNYENLLSSYLGPRDVIIFNTARKESLRVIGIIKNKKDNLWHKEKLEYVQFYCDKIFYRCAVLINSHFKFIVLKHIKAHIEERKMCVIERQKIMTTEKFLRGDFIVVDPFTQEVIEEHIISVNSCGQCHIKDSLEELESLDNFLDKFFQENNREFEKIRLCGQYQIEESLEELKSLDKFLNKVFQENNTELEKIRLLKDAAGQADVSIVDQKEFVERLIQICKKTDGWRVGEWSDLELFCHKINYVTKT